MSTLITLRNGDKTEIDGGVQRLANAIAKLQTNGCGWYELAEILVFNRHHAKSDLDFIAAIEKEAETGGAA